jgi:predicted nuclease of predicted toxin-antitoxin system
MKIVLDMNLSPSWADFLIKAGHEAKHWTQIGKPNAPDSEIMAWAKIEDYIVMSCDLDFGTILAVTKGEKPSVIQIRSDNLAQSKIGEIVIKALNQCKDELLLGALLTLNADKLRISLLPLKN